MKTLQGGCPAYHERTMPLPFPPSRFPARACGRCALPDRLAPRNGSGHRQQEDFR
jgi:hypothetical protein